MDLIISSETYTMLIMVPIIIAMVAVMFFLWVFTNGEAVFWLMRRHSGKIAVLEFDDSGRVLFKAEKPVGQGIYQGEEPNEYDLQPRSLGGDPEKAINAVSKERFDLYVDSMNKAMYARGKGEKYEPPPTLFQEIRDQVAKDLDGGRGGLETATALNSFRSYTWGLKVPIYLKYSGKAIVVNPAVAVVASQEPDSTVRVQTLKGPLVANVQNLKKWFSVMVTPSQMRSVVTRSKLIGARQLGSKTNWMPIIMLMVVLVGMVFAVFYILPMVGIKVF